MHIVGLLGMTRRVYTYDGGLGWDAYNLIETIGGFILAAGLLLILANLVWSYRRNEPAGRDPFHGGTLEWTVPSPPPHYNFAVIPAVTSAYPNWDPPFSSGLTLAEGHTTPVSTVNDALLDEAVDMPPESPWPSVLGLSVLVGFVLLLLGHYAFACVLFGLAVLVLTAWHAEPTPHTVVDERLARPNGWWGMAVFVATEATLFATLIGTYVYLRLGSKHWPPPGIAKPQVLVPMLLTLALVLTSPLVQIAWRRRVAAPLVAAAAIQTTYLVWQTHDFVGLIHSTPPSHSAYASILATMLAADHLHVLLGLLLVAWLLLRFARGLTDYALSGLRATAFYWHAVNTITVVVLLVQLSPHL
jgi:cytochrome c oxidase subunit I+III